MQVEARAAHELAGPPPALEVPPVDGELAALAGELTGEAGSDLGRRRVALRPPARAERGRRPPTTSSRRPAVPTAAEPDAEPEPEPSRSTSPTTRAGASGAEPAAERPDAGARPSSRADVAERTSRAGAPGASSPASVPSRRARPRHPSGRPTRRRRRGRSTRRRRPTPTPAPGATPCCARSQRELGRKVKRTLQDEQNDVLDRIRTVKGRPVALDVLPTTAAQVDVLAATLRGPVDAAVRRWSGRRRAPTRRRRPRRAAMVDGLAATMVERLHERLVDGDRRRRRTTTTSITQRLGARYREFKGQELDAIVGDTLAAAWALGVYDATPRGATLRWVAAVEGQCPDCDDNALEPTREGRAVPHRAAAPAGPPGCRCLLVPQSLTAGRRRPAPRPAVAAF